MGGKFGGGALLKPCRGQQTVLGVWGVGVEENMGDHLEAQDDGPDQPQRQPVVPIHDVM